MSPQPARHGERFARLAIGVLGVWVTTMFVGSAVRAAGDAAHGAVVYQMCQDCHSINENEVGPMHKGVVGRMSGTVPGYSYSSALRRAKIVWTEENLDRWLAGPQKLAPGTKMFFQLANAQDRADVIAFLKQHAR
jgi:cytochrome c